MSQQLDQANALKRATEPAVWKVEEWKMEVEGGRAKRIY